MNKVQKETATKVDGVIIGVVAAVNDAGEILVAYAGNPSELPVVAKSTVAVTSDAIGREVALLFEDGDAGRPIIMGLIVNDSTLLICEPQDTAEKDGEFTIDNWNNAENDQELSVDGEKIELLAKKEIVLKCGKSSITMTRAGKVIIRGTYISTKSSGANRIKGGSVQIN